MPPAPRRLRVEHLDEALGIRTTAPRLSWHLPEGAREQKAYRITADNGWDSGWMPSDREPAGALRRAAPDLGPARAVAGAGGAPTRAASPRVGERLVRDGPAVGARLAGDLGRARPDARRRAGRAARGVPALRVRRRPSRRVRPAARHRPGPVRGLPQRRAGGGRRADAGLHPVRRPAAGADVRRHRRGPGRPERHRASSWPTAGSAGRSASPARPTSGATGWRSSASCTWSTPTARPPSSAPGRGGAAGPATSSRRT